MGQSTCTTDCLLLAERRLKHRYYLRLVLVFNFMDQSLMNSRIAYQAIHPDNTETSKEFRLYLAFCRGIVENPQVDFRTDNLFQERGSHLPVYLDQRWTCNACKSDRKTNIGCSAIGCKGRGFCLTQKRNCFYDHHQLEWLDYYWLDLYWYEWFVVHEIKVETWVFESKVWFFPIRPTGSYMTQI